MKKFIFTFSFLMFSQFVSAYTIAEYKTEIQKGGVNKDYMEMYVIGVGQGFFWASIDSELKKKSAIFCPPKKLPFIGGMILSVLSNGIKDTRMRESDPVEYLLLNELIKVFPCN